MTGGRLLLLASAVKEDKSVAFTCRVPGRRVNNIFIVGDSPTTGRMVLASLLRALPDVSFAEASSGLEAVGRPAVAPVDLMILDSNMPDTHGLEVLDFLRRHHAYRQLIVFREFLPNELRGDDV